MTTVPLFSVLARVTLRKAFWRAVAMQRRLFFALWVNRWLPAVAVLVTILIGAGFAGIASVDSVVDPDLQALAPVVEPLSIPFASVGIGRLAVVVLAVLFFTGEFSSGQIATTMVAVPRRWLIIAAKGTVLVGVTFVVGVLAGGGLLSVSRVIFAATGTRWGASGVDQAWLVLSTGIQFALTALFALGVSACIRSTAGALVATLGVFLVLPMVTFGHQWLQAILPPASLSAVTTLPAPGGAMSAAMGLAVSSGWVVLALGLGAWSMESVDI